MTPAAKNAVLGVALLGGAWGAYRYVYVPWKIKQELLRQAAILAAQRGISQTDALALIGNVGCQAVSAYYGVPPMASGGVCSQLGKVASEIVHNLPTVYGGGKTVVGDVYGGSKTVVGDVYGGIKTVAHDINPLNWF